MIVRELSMTRCRVAILLLVLAFATAGARAGQTPAAPNLSGTWIGAISSADEGDRDEAYFVLKQTGVELTGTGGPNENQQWAISKGKVATTKEGTTAVFVVETDNMAMQFDLKLVDGRLKGSVSAKRDTAQRTGTVDLARAKSVQ
jgi:hypothetical protein